MKPFRFLFLAAFATLTFGAACAQAENAAPPESGKEKIFAVKPTLTARLVDPEKKAAQQTATVEVVVTGVALVDPAKSGEKPAVGQAHLHYQVDGGFVIATTAPKLSFHGLTKGTHKINVALAANDHTPLGPQETLTVTIP